MGRLMGIKTPLNHIPQKKLNISNHLSYCMSIRLNKAIKEFGVGLQSITDLLKEKGAPVASNDPNQKLDDKQYELLKKAFSADKNLRDKAEERMQDRQEKKRSANKAKKAEDNVVEIAVPEVKGPHIVGQIDVETAGKSKKQTGKNQKDNKISKAEANEAPAKCGNTPQANAATAANTPEAAERTGVEEEAVKAHADNSTSKPQPMTQNTNGNNKPSRPSVEERAKAIGEEENGVFKLKTQTEISGPKVLGTIDLSAINPTTRPKKKSKDERRRERNKQNGNNQGGAQQGAQAQGNGQRKKRNRIGSERVDVNNAANQPKQGGNNNGKKRRNENNQGTANNNNNGNNKNQNHNNNQNQGDSKRNNKNRNRRAKEQKAEVTEEDVAKQVKETLARLTSKQKGGKGAKYRKENANNSTHVPKKNAARLKPKARCLNSPSLLRLTSLLR